MLKINSSQNISKLQETQNVQHCLLLQVHFEPFLLWTYTWQKEKKHHQRASFGNITNGIYGRYIECFTHVLSNGTPMVCIVVPTPFYSHSNKLKLYRQKLRNSYSHETFLVIKLNTNTTALIDLWSNGLLISKNDWDARVDRKVRQASVGENGFCYTLISS